MSRKIGIMIVGLVLALLIVNIPATATEPFIISGEQNQSISVGGSAAYNITIVSQVDYDITVSLSIANPTSNWTTSITPSVILVPAGSYALSYLWVNSSEGVDPGDSYVAQLEATSSRGGFVDVQEYVTTVSGTPVEVAWGLNIGTSYETRITTNPGDAYPLKVNVLGISTETFSAGYEVVSHSGQTESPAISWEQLFTITTSVSQVTVQSQYDILITPLIGTNTSHWIQVKAKVTGTITELTATGRFVGVTENVYSISMDLASGEINTKNLGIGETAFYNFTISNVGLVEAPLALKFYTGGIGDTPTGILNKWNVKLYEYNTVTGEYDTARINGKGDWTNSTIDNSYITSIDTGETRKFQLQVTPTEGVRSGSDTIALGVIVEARVTSRIFENLGFGSAQPEAPTPFSATLLEYWWAILIVAVVSILLVLYFVQRRTAIKMQMIQCEAKGGDWNPALDMCQPKEKGSRKGPLGGGRY